MNGANCGELTFQIEEFIQLKDRCLEHLSPVKAFIPEDASIRDFTLDEIFQATEELMTTYPDIKTWPPEELIAKCKEIRLRK